MPLITCDICDKHNVPGSHGQDSTGCDVTQCYVCGGDEFDPYCEMEEAAPAPDIRAQVTREIREFYYDREEGSNQYRDLHEFEEKLERRAAEISRMCNSLIGKAARNPLLRDSDRAKITHRARCEEQKLLQEAFDTYKAEREAFFNDDLDAVADAMAAE